MISTRTGVAVSLLLAVVAVALGVAAAMASFRDDEHGRGRLVQTRVTNSFASDPLPFLLDEFFISRGDDGRLHALYAYPPGFFGHTRGCKVVWDAIATIDTSGGRAGPGLFVDPCGGARFDRDGTLVAGPADRGLDHFAVGPGLEGYVVDTRRLLCGEELQPDATATPAGDDEATVAPEPERTCERASPDEQD